MKQWYKRFLLKDLFEFTDNSIRLKEDKKCWFIVKRRCTHEDLMGICADNIMIVCDNAKHLKRRVYNTMLNTVVSPTSKLVMLG